MTQLVGYPAGNGLLSGTTQSQRPAPLGENRLPIPEATGLTAAQVATSLLQRRKPYVPFKLYGLLQNSAGLLGVTNHVTYEVPFDFVALRVHVENMASTAQINRLCAVAVSNDAIAAPTAPSGAWNNVLFSGTAAHATTACTSGAGTNDAITTDLVSDWLTLPSIPRTDGGTGRILMLRDFVPAAGNTTGNRADIGSTSLPISTTKLKCYFKAGDFVTTPAGFTTPTEWTMAPGVWLEFMTASGNISILNAGDSTFQGSDGGPMPNVAGGARLASELNYGRIALCNQGWASQTSTAYFTNGSAKLTSMKPTFGAFCPFSPNDSDKNTQAGINRMNKAAVDWIAACQAVGTVPILATPNPMNGISAADESLRRQVVTFVKQICSSGVALLADRDALYTDYTLATGGFRAGLNATTLHPNQVGYTLEASTVWAPLLSIYA